MTPKLSRRERQIMDILFRRGRATAAEVHQDLEDPPSYSAVRATLKILEDKGHVRHVEESLRYVYLPALGPEPAKRSAIRHLLDTFFQGSAAQAVAAILDGESARLKPEELERLAKLIDKAKGEQ